MAGASAALEDGQPVQGPDPEFEKWYLAQPRVALEVPAEGAQVLVVKFNDFQCPACGQSYQDYKSVLSKYEDARPGALRVVLKDFPLESECNANVTGDLHTGSCEAAVAMRLVNPEHADALEEWLYSNQSAMTPQSVKEAARNIGQIEDFDARYGVTLEAVKADIEYGRQLGIRSTPTFFINGTKVEGSLPAQYFDQAIAYELERATSQ
jgi:protein-disulfide isomerase